MTPPNFQEIIHQLQSFWSGQGCVIEQPLDMEVGAGTFHPSTFLRAVSIEPWNAAFVQPSRRPQDGRYGDNPNRLQRYYQFQVIMKPSPDDFQPLFRASLAALGIVAADHDIRFIEDDWESPTLGAWGLGWEVWIDGMETAQFTYFQEVGGIPVKPVMGEITYGLERLALFVQNRDDIHAIDWNGRLTYGDLHRQNEQEQSRYHFELIDPALQQRHFTDHETECHRLIEAGLPLPAYDAVIKCSHAFNLLDARGVISPTERITYIGRVRRLARLVAALYRQTRETQGFPLRPPSS